MKISPLVQEATTIPAMFFARAETSGARTAYEFEKDGSWRSVSFSAYSAEVLAVARGFRALGVTAGDCVAVWGATVPEWTVCDLAAMTAGAHVAGVYQTSTPEQTAYVLSDSRAKLVCVDTQARLDVVLSLRDSLPDLQHIVTWSAPPPAEKTVLTLEAVKEAGERAPLDAGDFLKELRPDFFASLVYTSGTTGPPKGVILDHHNCVWCCHAVLEDSDLLEEDDSTICYLPLSHVAEHTSFLSRIYAGVTMYFCPDMNELGRVMLEKSPTYLLGVPRVYEKIHGRIMSVVAQQPAKTRRLVAWALGVGKRVSRLQREGRNPGPLLALQRRVAHALVFSKMRAGLGGQLRFAVSGAAPMDVEIIDFFEALGIVFIEVYGLSESGGVSHLNRALARRPGTVGQPAAGVECRLAEDGEILLRSPMNFRGYLNQPEATAEVLDGEGWLHSGDIGEIDEDGFLRITDRKKNIIITAGGKNVAPATIEVLVQRDALVNQIVVLGDRKPYLVALITVSPEEVKREALTPAQVNERIGAAIDSANARLARYEQIKRFTCIPGEFTVESGELTPTMKIRRSKVIQHYGEIIAAMYRDDDRPETV